MNGEVKAMKFLYFILHFKALLNLVSPLSRQFGTDGDVFYGNKDQRHPISPLSIVDRLSEFPETG